MNDVPDFFRIPADELTAASPVPLTVLPDLSTLHQHMARAIADEIVANNQAARPTRLILPVGPVGYFRYLAEWSNGEAISWRNVHAFFMDEYCDWQGRAVPPTHPLSFAGYARRELFSHLDPEIALPNAQLHVPDPAQIDEISARISAVGGIDTCYGGIGIHGHIAFNEPPISRWFKVTPDQFKTSKTRLVTLAPETVVMNASRAAAGYFGALPPMAVTLGMADILGARRIRLYCQGGVWQRSVLRIALFGSPHGDSAGEDVDYPVTLLRGHPDFAVITDLNTAASAEPSMAA